MAFIVAYIVIYIAALEAAGAQQETGALSTSPAGAQQEPRPLRSVPVTTPEEFVAALAQQDVGEIRLTTHFVLREDAFPPEPVQVTRNLTIRGGGSDPTSWLLFNNSFVKDKVQLGHDVWWTFTGVVLTAGNDALAAAATRYCLLRDQRPGEYGVVLLQDTAALVELPSLPMPYRKTSAETRVRPARWPGAQTVVPAVSQEGCVNVTAGGGAANATAVPFVSRCWPARDVWIDVVFGAMRFAAASNAYLPTGQDQVLRRTEILCANVLPLECVKTYGPFGCLVLFSGGQQRPNATRQPPPAGEGEHRAPPQPDRSPPAEDQGTGSTDLLGPVLGGVLGGVAFIVLAITGALLLRRRRRPAGREDEEPAACTQAGSQGGGQWPYPLEALATGSTTVDHVHPDAPAPITTNTPHRPDVELSVRVSTAMSIAPSLLGSDKHQVASMSGGGSAGPSWRKASLPAPSSTDSAYTSSTQPSTAVPEVQLLPEVLGKGSYCSVVKGLYCGQEVAVKVLAFAHAGGGSEDESLRTLEQEVQVLGRCQHPNVVRLLAACLDPPRPCLVMELMDTCLAAMLYDNNAPPLPYETVLHIAVQVARGLEYLHPTVVHRDLKPANVLINSPSSPKPVAKLADLGLSRLRTTVVPTLTPEAGTPAYLAPESYDPLNTTITHQADIYALGVLLWEMLAGQHPWHGLSPVEIAVCLVVHQRRLPMHAIPQGRCPARLANLLTDMWDTDPRRRPAAAEVVKTLTLLQQEYKHGPCADSGGAAFPAAAAAGGDSLSPLAPQASPVRSPAPQQLHPDASPVDVAGLARDHAPSTGASQSAGAGSTAGRPNVWRRLPASALCASTTTGTVLLGLTASGRLPGHSGLLQQRAAAAHAEPACDPTTATAPTTGAAGQ